MTILIMLNVSIRVAMITAHAVVIIETKPDIFIILTVSADPTMELYQLLQLYEIG